MRLLTKIAVMFTLVCVLVICLNFFGGENQRLDTNPKYPPVKDTVNVIVSVNWTGSVAQIGKGYGSSTYYMRQLEYDVKDKISDLIKGLSEDKSLNLSYCYFGLVQPENSGGPNPDFKTNFIKSFKANCSDFSAGDWNSFLSKLKKEKKGHHTALTAARQLSAVLTAELIKKQFDENYLILITDNYYNVTDDSDISAEMDHLEKWSNGLGLSSNKRIRNINYAGKKAKAFLKYYTFSNLENVPILPGGLTEDDRHFEIRSFKIEPKIKQEPTNFLDFPGEIEYEDLSNDLIRVPLNLKYKDNALENSGYTFNKIVLSALHSENNDCFYQDTFESKIIPNQLVMQKPSQPPFKLEISAYYDYADNGIFNTYSEKHKIVIPCLKTGSGKLLRILPVKGKLLELHKSLGIQKGEIAAATSWNWFFIVTFILWILRLALPKIMPPIPRVKFKLEKGREDS